jgi:hypothetical protein
MSNFDFLVDQADGPSLLAGSKGILDKNTMTTAGVLVAAGTGVAGVALVTAVLPAQVLAASGISAGLIYAGDRQSKGLSINPFAPKSDDKAQVASATEASAPAPAAAA